MSPLRCDQFESVQFDRGGRAKHAMYPARHSNQPAISSVSSSHPDDGNRVPPHTERVQLITRRDTGIMSSLSTMTPDVVHWTPLIAQLTDHFVEYAGMLWSPDLEGPFTIGHPFPVSHCGQECWHPLDHSSWWCSCILVLVFLWLTPSTHTSNALLLSYGCLLCVCPPCYGI